MSNGMSALGSSFSIPASTDNTHWYEVGGAGSSFKVSLPAAGTYLVFGTIRYVGKVGGSGGGCMLAGLFNQDFSGIDYTVQASISISPYANSTVMIWSDDSGSNHQDQSSVSFSCIVTVAAAKTIVLGVARLDISSPTWTTSQIASDANGATTLGFISL